MGKEKYFLIFILLVGLGLRLIKLDQSFWLDEASQAQLSSLSLSQIWSNRPGDFQPPLFYFLAHYWLILGHSETWLRLLPVSFGVINIYIIYLLAKKIYLSSNPSPLKGEGNARGEVLGLLSAFLLAINPYHIYYSQEFRMYSLLALLGTLSMYLFFRKKYIWMAIINAALLYTHYSSIFLIATQFIISPIVIYYSLITLFLYFPWLPQFQHQLQSGVNIDTYLPGWRSILSLSPPKSLPLILFKFVAGRINLLPKYIYAVYIAFVLSVTATSLALARGKRRLLYTWLFVPIIASILLSFFIPQTQPFRLIFILPALIILMAEAAIRFPKLFLTLLIYISIVGNYTYFTRPRLQREQWRQAISFLSQQQGNIIVKFSDKFAPFYWYAPQLQILAIRNPNLLPPQLMGNVYLLEYLSDLTDPERKIDQTLVSRGYSLKKTHNYEGVGFIYEYSH